MAIKLLSNKPTPILAQKRAAQNRGLGSCASITLRKDHIAKVMVSVRMTSGIRMRVKRNNPTHVAMHRPVYSLALFPKAQIPNAEVSRQRPITESAMGKRAAQS